MQAAQGSTLTASELAEMRQRGEQFLLVDVREPAEFEIVRIPDSMLIPKGELPSRMSELPLDRPVILYCKTGIRSAESLAVLKAAGFSTAKHVQGGVTAWSLQVDRSLPIY
jgi:adenylyltransferase/sulfurtransferase